jgi:hypothetical protein
MTILAKELSLILNQCIRRHPNFDSPESEIRTMALALIIKRKAMANGEWGLTEKEDKELEMIFTYGVMALLPFAKQFEKLLNQQRMRR